MFAIKVNDNMTTKLLLVGGTAIIEPAIIGDGNSTIRVRPLDEAAGHYDFVIMGGEEAAKQVVNDIHDCLASGKTVFTMPEQVFEVDG